LLIDFTRPVALLAVAVAHFIPDTHALTTALARYHHALPARSYLIMSHATPKAPPNKPNKPARFTTAPPPRSCCATAPNSASSCTAGT
jgi:hypothetical protein